MDYRNKYPFVFVGGMLSWGEENGIYKGFPYWGMVCGNLCRQLRETGIEAYGPQVGPVNSAWDRACHLYAMLTGTRVDYGIAHAKSHKHARYGRTYEKPLFEGWGQPMADGGIKKVHLLGHSFGGVTMRLLAELLTNGSEEERKATKDGTLSPLFEGGHGDLIASITAISAPHDGTTFVHAFAPMMKAMTAGVAALFSVLGNTPANKFYDNYLENYGITVPAGQTNYENILNPKQLVRIRNLLKTGDHVFYDLRIDEASKINDRIHTCPDIYYFSVTGNGTKPDPKNPENQVRAPIMIFFFTPFAKVLGSFPAQKIGDYYVDASWHANDGLVPTESGRYPHKEAHVMYEDVKDQPLKKGVWHVLPDYIADHGTVIGGSLSYIGPGKGEPYRKYWRDHLEMLMGLED